MTAKTFKTAGGWAGENVSTYPVPVTPDDSARFEHITKDIHLGTGGDLAIVYPDGTTAVLPNLTAGHHPYGVIGILETDTTADEITVAY